MTRISTLISPLALVASAAMQVLGSLFVSAHVLHAQSKPTPQSRVEQRAAGTRTSLERSIELLKSGDSLGAVEVLRAAVEKDSRNGSLWHTYGMLLSEVNKKSRRNTDQVWAKDMIARAIATDSALALAMAFEPDSVQFLIDYADYLVRSRFQGEEQALDMRRKALTMLKSSSDSLRVSHVADQLAITLWHKFEAHIGMTAFRHPEDIADPLEDNGAGKPQTEGIATSASKGFDSSDPSQTQATNLVLTASNPGNDPPQFRSSDGMLAYLKTEYPQNEKMLGAGAFPEIKRYASTAIELNPSDEMAFRHLALMHAGLKQWSELEEASRIQISRRPRQAWPWLTLGLAQHNVGRTANALVAFDSGFARLNAEDTDRLLSIRRMLKSENASIYDTLSNVGREQMRKFYFNSANPSFLLGANPVLAEFRARVVYAELRFTNDETGLKGASSQAGDTWIRYGPPDYWTMRRPPVPIRVGIGGPPLNIWFYVPQHLAVAFYQGVLTGNRAMTRQTLGIMEQYVPIYPSAYENLDLVKRKMDKVSAQAARFRAGADSFDIIAFAGINPGSMRRDLQTDTSRIQHGMFVVDALGSEIVRSTGALKSTSRDVNAWVSGDYRVRAPISARGVRVEALESDAQVAASTIIQFEPLNTTGFGTSDLLIASELKSNESVAASRWSDFAITSLAGEQVERKTPVNLLWETYDATAMDGNVKLRYMISFERQTSNGFVARALKAVGAIANSVTGKATSNNRLGITYDRVAAVKPVIVDQLMVDLGAQDPGRYRLTLLVTDLNANKSKKTVQNFEIVK